MKYLFPLFILFNLYPAEAQVVRFTPTECLQTAISDLKDLLLSNPKATSQSIEGAVSWVFDLKETAKRSLGAGWGKATIDQQERFVKSFSKLLLSTYVSKLRKVSEVRIVFNTERVEGDRAVVSATVIEGENTHPFVFKLKVNLDFWQVYDITIENVGLVTNYRNEFAALIRKEGIEGLIKKLEDKVKDV